MEQIKCHRREKRSKNFTEATGKKNVYHVAIRDIRWWRGFNPDNQSKPGVLQFSEEQAAQSDFMQPRCKTDRITKYWGHNRSCSIFIYLLFTI